MGNQKDFSIIKYILGFSAILIIAYYTFIPSESLYSAPSYHFEEMDASHPFSVDATNLISTNTQDSVLKSRLNKYDVKNTLDTLLYAQDNVIINDTCLILGNISIPISSYNPIKKIGYIWLDYDRLGAGLMDHKLGNAKSQKKSELEFLNNLDIGLELYFDDEDQFLDDVFGNDSIVKAEEEIQWIINDWESALDSLRSEKLTFQEVNKRYQAYNMVTGTSTSTKTNNWDFFDQTLNKNSETVRKFGKEIRNKLSGLKTYSDQKEYLEIVLQDMRKQLEVEHLGSKKNKSILDDWKLSAAEFIKEPYRFFGMIKRMDQIRMQSPNRELISALNQQILRISTCKNSKSWWMHSNELIDLFNVNISPGLCNKKRYQNLLANIMNNDEYTEWRKRYHEIKELSGKENISLQELKLLNGIAYKSGIYIAPISVLDDRLIYDMKEEDYLQKLDSLRSEIKTTKNKSTRKFLQEKLLELTSYRATHYDDIRNEAKQKSKDVLQKDFKQFIEWAEEEKIKRNTDGV